MTKPKNDKPPLPDGGMLNLIAQAVELEAASPEGEASRTRRFNMVAYTGGTMVLAGWRFPVVVDLAGLEVGRQKRPILLDHTRDVDFVMGQTDTVAVQDNRLLVAGQVMGDSPKARQVVALNDKGFAWQASIGARAADVEFVPEGKAAEANGREFPGPVNVARRAVLGEISFVVLGADDNTSAQIAANAANGKENEDMDFEQWLEAQGFDASALSEKQSGSLRALHEAADRSDGADTVTATAGPAVSDAVASLRAELAVEAERVNAIRKICVGRGEIEAQAIKDGWDVTRTELEVLRASRPQGPAIHSDDGSGRSAHNIEAALCCSAGLTDQQLAKFYDDRTLEAANREYRGAGLHTLVYETIRASGGYVRPGRVDNQVIRAAFEADRQLRASGGFSTISLSGILSNVANKTMLAAYNAVESVAVRIAAQTDVSDFKEVTRYRMTGVGVFEKVGPDGELKHATLTEESYKNKIDTFGRIIALTRQMIINDDLGAFLQIPRIIGRMSALKREEAVFELLLSNPSSFFHADHKNLLTGADTALSIAALTKAEETFANQVDADGKPILLVSAILLAPTGLKVTAQQLMTETRVNETTAQGKPAPANNPHAGKWIPLASPYLNAQGLTGGSATAWYLFANPEDVAALEIAYLQGRRAPTIESGETDLNTLGMQWRGYFDFGVAMQDFRAAVKCAGA